MSNCMRRSHSSGKLTTVTDSVISNSGCIRRFGAHLEFLNAAGWVYRTLAYFLRRDFDRLSS